MLSVQVKFKDRLCLCLFAVIHAGRDYPLQDTQVVFVPPEYGASGMGLPSCSSGSDSGSGSGSGSGDCNEEPPTTQLVYVPALTSDS